MTLAAGAKLGPYEILSPLGAGGMGEVWRARDMRLSRDVAIKVLPAQLAGDADRLRRFEKEAQAICALTHPNIVTLFEVGREGTIVYIVMELVDGRTLRELLADGPLPLKKILALGPQIADGLSRAHEAGIVHRDLKPENVMVTRDGFAKILDFGLAKLTRREPDAGGSLLPTVTRPTEPGSVMGTVGYMSPEQAAGRAVDYRSDQFSLGAILYEMATRRRAFERDSAVQTLAAIVEDEPDPISGASPQVPAPFRWIVERCLAKDADERFTSTRDLARDLAAVRDHAGEAGGSDPAPITAPRTHFRLWGLLAAAILLAAALAYRSGRASWPAPPTFRQLTHRRGFVGTARFAPDSQTVVYSAAWEGNPVEVFSVRIGQPETRSLGFPGASLFALSSTGELALGVAANAIVDNGAIRLPGIWKGTLARAPLSGGAPRELRENVRFADWWGSEILAVIRGKEKGLLEFPVGKVIRATKLGLRYPRVSPRGDLAAFAEIDDSLETVSLLVTDRQGHARALTQGWSEVYGVAWHPSGRELWFWGKRPDGDQGLFAITIGGRQRLVARWPGSWALMDVASDGRLLASRLARRTSLLTLPPGEERERDLSWFDSSRLVDISADGRIVLFEERGPSTGGRPVAFVRSTDGSPPARLAEGVPRALSGDGRWAFLEQESGLIAVPRGIGERKTLARNDIIEWSFVSGFPDGGRVVFEGRDRRGRDGLYVQRVGEEPLPLGEDGLGRPFVSPDGRRVLGRFHRGEGTTIRIYFADAGPDVAPLQTMELPDSVEPSGWSADGRRLLLRGGGPDQSVVQVEWLDLATGQRKPIHEFRDADRAGALAGIGYILVAPDGKSYAYSVTRDFSDLYLVEGLK